MGEGIAHRADGLPKYFQLKAGRIAQGRGRVRGRARGRGGAGVLWVLWLVFFKTRRAQDLTRKDKVPRGAPLDELSSGEGWVVGDWCGGGNNNHCHNLTLCAVCGINNLLYERERYHGFGYTYKAFASDGFE